MSLQLSEEVLNRRVFNQEIFNLHSKEYMLGQTARFVDRFKNVLDIGAAVGMYSSFWASRCARIHSYEAVEPVYKQLKKLELKFDNITTHNIAMSDQVGQTSFFVDDKRLSNSSFRDLVGGQEITVNTTTIDNENHQNVGFIKIDVEGHELDVLIGGYETIKRDRPVCMVEVYPEFNNGPVQDTFDFFFIRNYKCYYNVKGEGLVNVDSPKKGVEVASDPVLIRQHDGDFLFVPEEHNGNIS